MGLGRALVDDEPVGDRRIRVALGHQRQNLSLSFGQLVQLGVGRRGEVGGERIEHEAGEPRREHRITVVHPADGVDLDKIKNTLRICASGGASLPVEVLRGFEEKFQVPILEGYGLSETSPVVTFNHPHKERKPGSVGTPVWGVEVRVVDEKDQDVPVGEPGEVIVRGHCVMKGYLNKPEATAEAFRGGWFHTGDLAVRHPDGYVEMKDRAKDIIITGGENVSSLEVEEHLYKHPQIMEAAVVARPDDHWGETVCAFVALKHGAGALDADEVIAWCRERMAHFKAPRHVVFGPLPKTSTGKIQKFELRERARDVG